MTTAPRPAEDAPGPRPLPPAFVVALGDLLGDLLAADLRAHPEEPPQRAARSGDARDTP